MLLGACIQTQHLGVAEDGPQLGANAFHIGARLEKHERVSDLGARRAAISARPLKRREDIRRDIQVEACGTKRRHGMQLSRWHVTSDVDRAAGLFRSPPLLKSGRVNESDFEPLILRHFLCLPFGNGIRIPIESRIDLTSRRHALRNDLLV
jgi:hypothetical protein